MSEGGPPEGGPPPGPPPGIRRASGVMTPYNDVYSDEDIYDSDELNDIYDSGNCFHCLLNANTSAVCGVDEDVGSEDDDGFQYDDDGNAIGVDRTRKPSRVEIAEILSILQVSTLNSAARDESSPPPPPPPAHMRPETESPPPPPPPAETRDRADSSPPPPPPPQTDAATATKRGFLPPARADSPSPSAPASANPAVRKKGRVSMLAEQGEMDLLVEEDGGHGSGSDVSPTTKAARQLGIESETKV